MNTNIEKFYPDIVITPGDIILEHMEANNSNQRRECIALKKERNSLYIKKKETKLK